ncbi:MAG: protein kinase [Planctomycetota bacterium]
MPERIDRWRLVRFIAEGGMGMVFEGEDIDTEQPVAIKIAKLDLVADRTNEAAKFEAELMGLLRGVAHVPALQGAGAFVDHFGHTRRYFVMDYLGEDVQSLTAYASRRRLGFARRLDHLAAACRAIAFIHEKKGLPHLDIKPSNLLIGEHDRLWVTDYGLSRPLIMRRGDPVGGTFEYMSPEHLRGRIESKQTLCDVFSMGVVGYKLLANATPYPLREGEGYEDRAATIESSRPARTSMPPVLEGALRKAVSPRPEDRWEDMKSLGRSLYWRGLIWRARWAIVLISILLAITQGASFGQRVGVPLSFQLTGVHGYWQTFVAATSPTPGPWLHTAVVLYDEDTAPFEAAARALEMEGFRWPLGPGAERDRTDLRRFHAAFCDLMANSGARAVVFDLYFSSETEHDAAFADAMRRLMQAGTNVVIGEQNWTRHPDGSPKLSRLLLEAEPLTGTIVVTPIEGGGFLVPLVVHGSEYEDPQRSLAFAAYLAASKPGASSTARFDADRGVIEIEHWPIGDRVGQRRRIGPVQEHASFDVLEFPPDPTGFSRPNAPSGPQPCHTFVVRPETTLAAHIYTYTDLFELDPTELQRRFADRIVVISSRHRVTAHGRTLQGAVVQGEAIESMVRASPSPLATNTRTRRLFLGVAAVGALVGALVGGVALMLPGRRRWRWATSFVAVGALGVVVVQWLMERQGQLVTDPASTLVGAAGAAVLMGLVTWYLSPLARAPIANVARA